VQQSLAQRLGLSSQKPLRQPWPVERVDGKVYIGILVVDDRADDALRQVVRLVAELLARLVEFLRDIAWRRAIPSGTASSASDPGV
jgi:histidinol-phosphate/aromatic aminotransferase/cobyric acid decarboxylase-like protein